MDWLALLFKHFNMRGTYQLCSVFEEGVLAHQSIRRYDGRNWTGKNVLQRRNQLRKIIRPGHFSSGQQPHCRARDRAIQVTKEKGLEGIRGVRLHRRKRKPKAFWRTAPRCVPKREAALFGSLNDTATTEIGERRVGKECRSRWSPYH